MSGIDNTEKTKQIVVSAEDCKSALEFWKHFNIPIAESLQKAVDEFAATPTFENQEVLKLELFRAIVNSDHEAFKDELFREITEECSTLMWEMTFDKDLEETLVEKKD